MAGTNEFMDLPVRAVMTFHPAVVGPEDPLGDAARIMVEGGFRHVPVVDADQHVVGMLSERDLRTRLGVEIERFPEAASSVLDEEVETIMSRAPITVDPEAPLRDVVGILADERIGAVPIVDDAERLLGIVSYLDVLAYLNAMGRGDVRVT